MTNSRNSAFPVPQTQAEIAYKHIRVLLHALHTAHPVLYEGKVAFLHTISCGRQGGGIDYTIYLAGIEKPVAADAVQLQPQPV